MFETLIESTGARERPVRSSLLSLACHLGVLVAAVVATRAAAEAAPADPTVIDVPYVHLPPQRTQPVTAPPTSPATSAGLSAIVIEVPIDVPINLPPIALGADDATTLRHLLGQPDHDPFTPEGAPLYPEPRDDILAANLVDEQVRWLNGPRPEYPAALRAAGLEGVVMLQMVVDTNGRVEPGSIEVQSSTHAGFEAAAINAVSRARFRPAHLGGRPVRQLVQQNVRFALERK
jgi:TonB family protein